MLGRIIKNFRKEDERYENLYLLYSKTKLELKNLEDRKNKEGEVFREKMRTQVAKNLIIVYDCVDNLINSSKEISHQTNDVQKTMLDISTLNRKLTEVMKRFDLKTFKPESDYYNKEEQDILRLESNPSFEDNKIIKVVSFGIKFKDKIMKKAKVIVSKLHKKN